MTNNVKFYSVLSVVIGTLGISLDQSQCNAQTDNSTVNALEINRFMGKWYEIARYDHFFEKGMTNVSAEYSMLDDGKIRVINRGIKNGKNKVITGKVKYPDPMKDPGKLKVSFFLWFYSDYYVMYVDSDYEQALIGSSSDKYLWILSRTPQISESKSDFLIQILKRRGYDTSKLIFSD